MASGRSSPRTTTTMPDAAHALGVWWTELAAVLGPLGEPWTDAMFPGLVVAALVGAPLVAGAAGGVALAAAGVAVAGRTPEVGRDTAVAVVVTALLGAGA